MQRLIQDLKSGDFKKIYLLYGQEAYLRKQYKDKLKEAMIGDDTMNFSYYEGKDFTVGEVIDQAETMPFFADRRLILIENSGLFKSGGEQMAEYLKSPAESVNFLFVETEVDKRSKLFKAVQANGCAVEFVTQDETTLKRWILQMIKKENKNISERTLNLLLEKTGTDMENIHKECEKLFCYCLDKDVITEQDVEAICTKRITSHIFDMVEAIANKNQKKALELYYELIALKEPPMRILFLIARQFNQLLLVRELQASGADRGTVASKLKVPPFVAGKLSSQAAAFTKEQLISYVQTCVDAEEAVKTGRMGDRLAVELLEASTASASMTMAASRVCGRGPG